MTYQHSDNSESATGRRYEVTEISDRIWNGNIIDGDYVSLSRRDLDDLVRLILSEALAIKALTISSQSYECTEKHKLGKRSKK